MSLKIAALRVFGTEVLLIKVPYKTGRMYFDIFPVESTVSESFISLSMTSSTAFSSSQNPKRI